MVFGYVLLYSLWVLCWICTCTNWKLSTRLLYQYVRTLLGQDININKINVCFWYYFIDYNMFGAQKLNIILKPSCTLQNIVTQKLQVYTYSDTSADYSGSRFF